MSLNLGEAISSLMEALAQNSGGGGRNTENGGNRGVNFHYHMSSSGDGVGLISMNDPQMMPDLSSLFNMTSRIFPAGLSSSIDDIITNMMENWTSTAKGASEASLAQVEAEAEVVEVPEDWGTCSICLDNLEPGDKANRLTCRHFYHSECILSWLKKSVTCPVCRTDVALCEESAEGEHKSESNNNDDLDVSVATEEQGI